MALNSAREVYRLEKVNSWGHGSGRAWTLPESLIIVLLSPVWTEALLQHTEEKEQQAVTGAQSTVFIQTGLFCLFTP